MKREPKSAKMNFWLEPSLLAAIKEEAALEGVSDSFLVRRGAIASLKKAGRNWTPEVQK